MATIANALDSNFTPAAGDFIVSVSGGTASLNRKNTSGGAFVEVGRITSAGVIVSNPVAGAVYRLTAVNGLPVVQADQ